MTNDESRAITYCSFAEPDKCLGVVILPGALDPIMASLMCHAAGINPGGQLMAIDAYEGEIDQGAFDVMWANRNRLIGKDEAIALFDAKRLGDLENEEQGK